MALYALCTDAVWFEYRHGIPSKLVQDAITEIVDDFNSHSRKIRSATGVKSRYESNNSCENDLIIIITRHENINQKC